MFFDPIITSLPAEDEDELSQAFLYDILLPFSSSWQYAWIEFCFRLNGALDFADVLVPDKLTTTKTRGWLQDMITAAAGE
jgi:hypothetical protein